MTVKYINVPLLDNPYYTYKYSLNKVDYIFTFRFSSREKCWYMDLHAADTTPLVLSTKLVPDYPMLWDFVIPGLDGFFWLSAANPENNGLFYSQPETLPDFFILNYFFTT